MDLSSTILASLPDLPQVKYIHHAAQALGPRQGVQALWLGGSFARGDADRFSDVDMRIAVARDDIERGENRTGSDSSVILSSVSSSCHSL